MTSHCDQEQGMVLLFQWKCGIQNSIWLQEPRKRPNCSSYLLLIADPMVMLLGCRLWSTLSTSVSTNVAISSPSEIDFRLRIKPIYCSFLCSKPNPTTPIQYQEPTSSTANNWMSSCDVACYRQHAFCSQLKLAPNHCSNTLQTASVPAYLPSSEEQKEGGVIRVQIAMVKCL